MHTQKRRGEVAQAIFVQRAMAEGFCVAEPFGDSHAFDYLVGLGTRFWRVQVKSSTCWTTRCTR